MVSDGLRLREEETGRFRASLRAGIPFAVLFAFILVTNPLRALLAGEIGNDTMANTLLNQILLINQYGIAIGLFVWMATRLDRRSLGDFGLAIDSEWLQNAIVGFGCGSLALVLSLWYAQLRGVIAVEQGGGVSNLPPAFLFVGLLLVVAVLGAFLTQNVYEEALFRGGMLQNFAEGLTMRGYSANWAVLLAVVGSCLFFGISHIERGPLMVLDSLVVGLVFALAYLLTGSLGLAVGVHFSRFPIELLLGADSGADELGLPVVEFTAVAPDVELVRLAITSMLLLAWVRVRYGEIGIAETVYQPTHEQVPD